uniref:Tetratricopeptide repeat family protein n=1 Tax=uncultured bacterium contig00021 TaxID=1181511 RepID=A0A806K2A5_9BACT|nr:tetratricopeptide repeat family protein [uncultured bacterium contig00021]
MKIIYFKTFLIFFTLFYSCASTNSNTEINVLNESEKLERYNQLLSRGLQLSNVNENQSAMEVYSEAIRLLPERSEAYYRRSVNYYLWNSYPPKIELAINDITSAIKYDPRNADYFVLRGDLYFRYSSEYPISNIGRMSLEEYRNREYSYYLSNMNKAISDYSTAIRLDTRNYEYYFKRGGLYLFIKDWNKAIVDLTVVIENIDINRLDNWNIRHAYEYSYRYRGMAYYQIGRVDLATNDFRMYSELSGREYTINDYITQEEREAEQNRQLGKIR